MRPQTPVAKANSPNPLKHIAPHNLKLRKDVARLQSHGIARTSSFKELHFQKVENLQTIRIPPDAKGVSTPTELVPRHDVQKFYISKRKPAALTKLIPVKPAEVDNQEEKEKYTNPQGPGYQVCQRVHNMVNALVYKFQAKMPMYLTPPVAVLNDHTIAMVDRIRQKIQTFPSVTHQLSKGPNYTPSWSWTMHLDKLTEDCRMSADLGEANKRLMEFYLQACKAASLLEQIREAFQFGLLNYDNDKGSLELESGYSQLMTDFNILRIGERGRSTLDSSVFPYTSEIFQNQMQKQNVYAKWSTKPLPQLGVIGKRQDMVKWLLQTGVLLKYPAETIHLAVHLVDAFLVAGYKAFPRYWNLLAIAALQIAGKLEEPEPATTKRLITYGTEFYRPMEVTTIEEVMLRKLEFDIHPPLAPYFSQLVLLGGSLQFPSLNTMKLVMDLSNGMLYNSLLNYNQFKVRASEKAQAALEIAVDFVFFQYKHFNRKDMRHYAYTSCEPGKDAGELAVKLSSELFEERFAKRFDVVPVNSLGRGVPCMASPSQMKDIRV